MRRILTFIMTLALSCGLTAADGNIAHDNLLTISPHVGPGSIGTFDIVGGLLLGVNDTSKVIIDAGGIRGLGTAIPDFSASRILIKIDRLIIVAASGQVTEIQVDGYIEADGKDHIPGLLANYNAHLADPDKGPTLSLPSGIKGRLILLMSARIPGSH